MGLTFPLSEPRSLKSLLCSWNEEIKNPVYLNVTLSDKDRWLNALLTRLAISATGACLFLVKWGWTIRRDDRYRSCCTKLASLTWNVICSFRRCRMAQRKKKICEQLRTGETFKVLIAICNGSRTWVVCMRNGWQMSAVSRHEVIAGNLPQTDQVRCFCRSKAC